MPLLQDVSIGAVTARIRSHVGLDRLSVKCGTVRHTSLWVHASIRELKKCGLYLQIEVIYLLRDHVNQVAVLGALTGLIRIPYTRSDHGNFSYKYVEMTAVMLKLEVGKRSRLGTSPLTYHKIDLMTL